MVAEQNKQAQEYDNRLKVLFGNEASQIVPRLVPGTRLLDEKNIELDRSQLKADLVYTAMYKRRLHIVNVELQVKTDKNMVYRLLQYHAGLHAKYKKPVLSVVLYPFAKSVPRSPYRERGGDGVLLTWKYRAIALCTIEAEPFVREQAFYMYSMLPAMRGATVDLLSQALKEMKQRYEPEELGQHLALFWRMLQKSRTLTRQEKDQVEEVIKMESNWWIESNPVLKKYIDREARKVARAAVKAAKKEPRKEGWLEGNVEGRIEGKAEGALEVARQIVLNLVQARFPAQLSLAQQRVAMLTHPAQLSQLVLDISLASDEVAVMHLLTDQGATQPARRKKKRQTMDE